MEVFYTHSINDLLEMTLEVDTEFEDVMQAKKLDQYSIPTRYPNVLPGGVPSRFFDDPEEAEDAKHLAKSVLMLVERRFHPPLIGELRWDIIEGERWRRVNDFWM